MSEPISAGDLVQVVSECCDPGAVRGRIGNVLEISRGFFECEDCRYQHTGVQAHIEGFATEEDSTYEILGWVPIEWLKRIPPLSELEGEKQKEDLREPA